MTDKEVIASVAETRMIEEIYRGLRHGEQQFNLDDLTQDLLLSLMQKPAGFVSGLYERQELRYYLTRMIINNIRSTTSPYYSQYKIYDSEYPTDA